MPEPAADGMDVDTGRLEIRRRRGWQRTILAVLVVGALSLGALWWNQRGFDPGDTLQVTAHVGECGYVRTDAGGEQWQSEEPRPTTFRGAILGGTLERLSGNEAVYRYPGEESSLLMQRLRSDYFWSAGGCVEPNI